MKTLSCNKLFLILLLFSMHAQPTYATSFVDGLPRQDQEEAQDTQSFFDPEQEFWDWDEINTDDVCFPKDFVWGTATSAHQVEKDCTNNDWSKIEQTRNEQGILLKQTGKPFDTLQNAGTACEHIKNFQSDVQRMNDLGTNAYRMSIEWSKLEPKEGVFSEEAAKVYDAMFDELLKNDKQIIVTLHHYTNPAWFAQKGGFEKEENSNDFVRFCTWAYKRWNKQVKFWITFNAPAGYALSCYHRGVFPPFKKNMKLATQVLKHICQAHVQVYKACKKINDKPQIGVLHHIFQTKPYYTWYPVHQITSYFGDMLNNQALINFFQTGTLSFGPLSLFLGSYTDKDAPNCNDFIGLSFYSHGHLSGLAGTTLTHLPNDIPTDKSTFVVYAEGMYHAIQRIAQLGKPIYIMENGIGDEKDTNRKLFLQRYLFAISQAIADGYDVRGYVYWSLLDNYEWLQGYNERFGLYEVDFETQERKLRKSALYLTNVIKTKSGSPVKA
jgi:beta-glucosidase